MNVRARKFNARIAMSIPPDAEDLFTFFSSKYDMTYLGVYTSEDKLYVYLQFKNRISQCKLLELLVGIGIKVTTIDNDKKISGDIISEHGERKRMGGTSKRKRDAPSTVNNTTINNIDNSTNNTTNNNNINVIIVNPIGSESLEHITPEFIQELLSEHHGPDVVFRFGTKMYSLQENMNFKTDLKSGYISGRLEQDGAWETHRKNDGFSMLLDNLKDKNEQAVLKHLEGIPNEDLKKFELDMGWIREHKYSGLQEDEPVYNKFMREGFNLLTANIADKVRRIERDSGKKLKLV
jgi:hypothetical protein